MGKIVVLVIGALVIVGGALYLVMAPAAPATDTTTPIEETNGVVEQEVGHTDPNDREGEDEDHEGMQHEQNGTVEEGTPTTNDDGAAVKEFVVTGTNYAYSVKEMRVKKGDTVRVVYTTESGFHDWVVDEFPGAKTQKYNAGGTETIEFVANKAGTFEYYCSVGSHRQMGMVGSLIVEE